MKYTGRSSRAALIMVLSLFFLWGFAHNLDSILIPHLKKACQLTNSQSMLVDTSVFLAYFIMAIPAGMIMRKWGYKAGLITGLLLFAAGAFLFVPAANTRNYGLFITGLFIIGIGLAMLETGANPYATVLGPPESAAVRLNFAQAFNGLAAMLAPVIGGAFILSGKTHSDAAINAMTEAEKISYLTTEASAVKLPYTILGIVLLLIVIVFAFIKLPDIKEDEAESFSFSKTFRVLKIDRLRYAVIAQFFYVGAQVCITSVFIRTAIQSGGLNEKTAASYLGWGYGLAFMTGRFAGTALLARIYPKRLLAIYSLCSIVLCIIAFSASGMIVVWALIGLGFCMSIMYPTIFSEGIRGLGSDTKAGASLIVMSIVGGSLLPLLMGTIIDRSGDNTRTGFLVPLACYLVVLLFAIRKTVPDKKLQLTPVA
jgi:FHS family L-fucose permease-like MFS transporter